MSDQTYWSFVFNKISRQLIFFFSKLLLKLFQINYLQLNLIPLKDLPNPFIPPFEEHQSICDLLFHYELRVSV